MDKHTLKKYHSDLEKYTLVNSTGESRNSLSIFISALEHVCLCIELLINVV